MKHILIVDDIKVNLKVLEVLLSRNGYKTTSALSGKDALGLLQVNPVDLIISDILMPEMDGFQFCRLCGLDENLKHIPFIFYSSTHTEATARNLAGKVGAKAFITKPADPARMLKTIDSVLKGHDFLSPDHGKFIEGNGAPLKRKISQPPPLSHDKKACHALLKNIPCVVWTIDASGNIAYISPAVETITGFTMDYLLKTGKRQWLTRIHPDHMNAVKKSYKSLYENQVAMDIEYRFECRNGEFIWLHEKSGRPYTKNGIQYADGISLDISEKKYLQAHQIKSAHHQTLQTFTRGIARDLSTLITGITGCIELSAMETSPPAQQQAFLTRALKITHSASELTRELFALSSSRNPAREDILLSEVVAAVTQEVLQDNTIEVKLEIPPDLWPCPVAPNPMRRAMANILLNATESLETNGFIEVILQNLSIEKTAYISDNILYPGNYIKITIRDNGPGIDTAHLSRIFHPYFTTKPRDTLGKGLGLTMSQAVIHQHGGVMSATSPSKAGTTMDIYIPVPESKENTMTASPRSPAPPMDRILMVDEDEMVHHITCELLERSGFQVTCVKNATHACTTVKEATASARPFRVILMDIMTDNEKITSAIALESIRKIDPDILAIATSADPYDPVMAHFRQYGFNATLPKPFVAEALVATIKNQLNDLSG